MIILQVKKLGFNQENDFDNLKGLLINEMNECKYEFNYYFDQVVMKREQYSKLCNYQKMVLLERQEKVKNVMLKKARSDKNMTKES